MLFALWGWSVSGQSVVVALARPGADGVAVSLAGEQALWPAPFGGWVAAVWPFDLRLNDRPILEFRSGERQLRDQAATGMLEPAPLEIADPLLLLEGSQEASAVVDPLRSPQFERPSMARLELPAGRYVLHPFELEFTVAAGGVLGCADPRARVDVAARRLTVLCHPVIIRTLAAGRSVAAPLSVAVGRRNVLAGFAELAAEYGRHAPGKTILPEAGVFERLTIFLPASPAGQPYEVNGVGFVVAADGRVELEAGGNGRAECVMGREIRLAGPVAPSPSPARRTLGLRWRGVEAGGRIVVGEQSVECRQAVGAASLLLPAAGGQAVRLGDLTATLPAATAEWPQQLLVWTAEAASAWLVETAGLWLPPGDEFRCRLTRLAGATLVPERWRIRLEAEPGGGVGGEVELGRRPDGSFGGALAAAGLWRLRAVEGPLAGEVLGLALVAEREPTTAVSLFTANNRGIFRRGDPVELFWVSPATAGPPPVEWRVVVRGLGLELSVRMSPTAGEPAARSGRLRLASEALAPGEYEAVPVGEGVAGYGVRFRICQREPLSDYELYSYVYGNAQPYGGSPVNAYYGKLPGGAGLAPFLAATDVSLEPALAVYAEAAQGPALERFRRPTEDESKLLALASLGMRAVPAYPPMLHHEDWNPKHTLPEDLAQMRRRLALFVQPWADVAGLGGLALGWYGSLTGYWEESPCLDGHQAMRNAAAQQWVAERVAAEVERAKASGVDDEDELRRLAERVGLRCRSSILPNAFEQWLADARQLLPELTAHNALPSWWLGGGQGYAPNAYATLTQRDAVDYSDYGITAWGNFRAPAWMGMGNPQRQRLHGEFMTWGRHSRLATAFGATGRGLDGWSLTFDEAHPQGEDLALLRIFERFGPWFSAFEPLPDVAVYNTNTNPQNVLLHDLARMRRPGMLLGLEDVLAGELGKYRVLFLVSAGAGEPAGVLAAFQAFEAGGGVILKDRTCHASLPGRDIGFGYEGSQIHPVWGLAYANGEDEFAHLWKHFKETREPFLSAAFAQLPGLPATTSEADVVISPLAGQESIICFVINQTLVPLGVAGKWRQHAVLPKIGELRVEDGWQVYDLLAGRPVVVERLARGGRVAVDFTRAEGAIYLLTRREPVAMAIRSERTAPRTVRLTAWLADAEERPLVDPMPFEVTLRGADGGILFRRFVALSPERAVEVPVPARSDGQELELEVRDLLLGSLATQAIAAAPATAVEVTDGPDLVGGTGPLAAFFAVRKGPVTVLLDEGQEAFRPAAVDLAGLLAKVGRKARVATWETADVRPLPLRWVPLAADLALVERLREGSGFAWRIGLGAVQKSDAKGNRQIVFDDPACGYDEYGPRLRHDADIVLFGTPESQRAVAELVPFLRRVPSPNYPAPGGFFIHYLWSPFQGGHDGLYIGCRDAAGAAAALAALGGLANLDKQVQPPPVAPAASPVTTRGGAPLPLDDLVSGKFGTRILDLAFAPSGGRIFVTADSYGDSLFALTPNGEITASRALNNRCGNSLWWRNGGRLRAVDEDTVRVTLGPAEYYYSFENGWLGRAVPPSTGFSGRFQVPVAASTVLEDAKRGQAYLGGARLLVCRGGQAQRRWQYDDFELRTSTDDLLYPRSLFPRAISGNGRVLLVAGFGIQHDCYGRGKAVNASVFGLDTATGERLWQRDGLLLNEGRAIPMDDRFLVVDDSGLMQVFDAGTGATLGQPRPVGGVDWLLPVPGEEALLLVDNGHFDRHGPQARVVVRPLDDGPERRLPVAGRVTDVALTADGQACLLASERGETVCCALDGTVRWRTATPTGGILRLAPDGRQALVGGRDGVLRWLSLADGEVVRHLDLNPFNVTDGDRFVRQMAEPGGWAVGHALTVPPLPPEPSYVGAFPAGQVSFGENLIAGERLRAALPASALAADDPAQPGYCGRVDDTVAFALPVEAGKTYLIECLAGAAEMTAWSPQERLEIAVVLPGGVVGQASFVARLPLGRHLARRRAAFRAEATGEATLTLRTVRPRMVGEGRKAQLSYADPQAGVAGALVGDLLVAAMGFVGRNLVYEGGPEAQSRPAGRLECEVKPWTGGDSTLRWQPYPCPAAALRLVDGVINNQETAWTTEAKGEGIAHADARIRFAKPQSLSAVAVYEDNSGPVAVGDGVRERVARRFAIYLREARTGKWHRLGQVVDNVNLVNVFACPPIEVDEIHYFWAGRHQVELTDGLVRLAEIEVYASEDALLFLDGPGAGGGDDLLRLAP